AADTTVITGAGTCAVVSSAADLLPCGGSRNRLVSHPDDLSDGDCDVLCGGVPHDSCSARFFGGQGASWLRAPASGLDAESASVRSPVRQAQGPEPVEGLALAATKPFSRSEAKSNTSGEFCMPPRLTHRDIAEHCGCDKSTV